MGKPLVDTKLLIKGKLRLRDIEEIMLRLRDEFNITEFQLQIDDVYNMDNNNHFQKIILRQDIIIKPKKQYVWILDFGSPQPFNTKKEAYAHKQYLIDNKYLDESKENCFINKKLIICG